ncbi:PTS sugar transporter subunit IIA [Nissabacter sp. SGAir0207]|uniref:PTS sugar transporter subunit IIA n=1 Tax=Nissabacter sp. SGAir0207 TaxID=2126321 RepID=UPI0010CCBD91|nr:PTS sugar transporter subunit IIA [Nissabacter sp. SGAir0207]QCR35475.1 PTS ascorbate transporter subunit IIA [Nissabacter sp. SGAir0207]
MLNQWLTDDRLHYCREVADWQEAVRLSARPLLQQGIITPAYVEAIFRQHQTLGPYFVLAPGLAMPHARPEEGATGLGLSLLKLGKGVCFHSADNDPVSVVVMLAAPDGHRHLELLSQLAELFSDDTAMQELFHAQTTQQISTVISRF